MATSAAEMIRHALILGMCSDISRDHVHAADGIFYSVVVVSRVIHRRLPGECSDK